MTQGSLRRHRPNIFRSTTRYLLTHRDSPYILHQVAHRSDGGLEKDVFPTWVPQWHRHLQDGAPSRLGIKFHCWPHNQLVKPKDKCADREANVLRLDGVVIDTMNAVTEPLRSAQSPRSHRDERICDHGGRCSEGCLTQANDR